MMCGPFIAATMNGMVRNGPTPTMPMMLVAVACSRPMPRSSVTIAATGRAISAIGGRRASRHQRVERERLARGVERLRQRRARPSARS